MKKIKYLLLIIACLFMGVLNVKAISESDLKELKLTVDKNTNICIYKNDKDYVVIGFAENKDNNSKDKYRITNYGDERRFNEINFITNNECEKLFVTVVNNQTNNSEVINVGYDKDLVGKYGKLYEVIDKNNILNEESITESESSRCTLEFSKGFQLYFGTYDKNNFYYKATTSSSNIEIKICPATSNGGNTYSINDKFDSSKFDCDKNKWQIVENKSTAMSCDYFLLDKNEQLVGVEDESINFEEEGEIVTTYYEYRGSSNTIRIIKNSDGTYKATDKSGKTITAITSNLIKNNVIGKEKYPVYLLKGKGADQWIFDNEKKGEFSEVYMNVLALNDLSNIPPEEQYSTCYDIFGSNEEQDSLLTWLREHVFIYVWIGVPIILIVLTSFDFAKVVFSDDKEGMPNAVRNLIKRGIAAVLIFLTPTIILTIANLLSVGKEDKTLQSVTDCVKFVNQWTENSGS